MERLPLLSSVLKAAAMNMELDKLLNKIAEKFSVEFEPLDIDGVSLQILQITNMTAYLDRLAPHIVNPLRDLPLWAKVWPGSFILGRFLRNLNPQGKTLLELGAGMGVCSLTAARFGFSRIFLTDCEEDALNFARANVLKNSLQDIVEVKRLDLLRGGTDQRFNAGIDLVAGSEILYLDNLHRPLLKFLKRHLAPGGKALFCTDMKRSKPRFLKLAQEDFHIQKGQIGLKSSDRDAEKEVKVFEILILEAK